MRTKKSAINLISNIISLFIISFGKFFLTKLFIQRLGSDINGLYQLFGQIVAYLNLAEGGVGTALTFALYKPLSEKNIFKINNILSTVRRVYVYIGFAVLVMSIILSPFLNKFINTNLRAKELGVLFVLYTFKISIDYFTNISRFLLQADQKEYKLNFIITIFKSLDMILQFYLLVSGYSLYFILIKEIVIILLTNEFIKIKVRKEYKWLNLNSKIKDYSCLKNTKYLVIHSLCSAIVYNTDYILLGKFQNLKDITLYSSYLMLINFVLSIPLRAINSLGASLGNLITENDLKKLKQVFLELFTITFYIASICGIIIYYTVSDFITLWLGRDFVINKMSVLMLVLIFVHSLTRQPTGILVNSSGLFKETRQSVLIEMILNLGISLSLVKKYGIEGVILGTLLAHLFSNFWYYPLVCYRKVLKDRMINYIKIYFENLIEFICLFLLNEFMVRNYLNFNLTIQSFIFKVIILVVVNFTFQTVFYYLRWRSMREFVNRIYKLIFKVE